MKNLLLLFVLSLSFVSCFDNDRDDNLDLNVKVRVFEAGRESTPVMVAVVAGKW